MKHPKSEDILKVVNNFKKVLKRYPEGKLAMRKAAVNRDHDCGTVHCHGGWYAVVACDLDRDLKFSDGAIKMAQDLGFEWCYLLLGWVGQNTKIWGNKYGRHMFLDSRAFYQPKKRPDGAKNLQHIVDHWEEVYERVKKMEEIKNVGAL